MTSAGGPAAAFIDWWFAPWRLGGPPLPDACAGALARRDAYRYWCAQAAVAPDLPAQADWDWQDQAGIDGATLVRAAELFGGLLAARRQCRDTLAALPAAQRRWCLAVAMTQPLTAWSDAGVAAGPPRACGLAEFALRADRALPGLWSRLALLVPPEARPRVRAREDAPVTLRQRDRRCWLLCVSQARLADAGHFDGE